MQMMYSFNYNFIFIAIRNFQPLLLINFALENITYRAANINLCLII